MITSIDQLDLSKQYTYQDYLSWKFEESVELINGTVYQLMPAPTVDHQGVVFNLSVQIGIYLRGKQCRAFPAPFDVRLPLPPEQQTDRKINTVVQPDISVICDLSKLDRRGCLGAPDWVIEILSPYTSARDLNEKFDIYEHAGVKEYWVVYPADQMVVPYVLDDKGKFQLVRNRSFWRGEQVPVATFPGFSIPLEKVFPETGFYG